MTQITKTLDVVIPVFNEEECLPALFERLLALQSSLGERLRFIFVNDGSRDHTPEMLDAFARSNTCSEVIHFSRNFGHQIAITAGIDYSTADYVVTIDADLQDPPEFIEELYKKAEEGYEVVFAQRLARHGETWFKKMTAKLFYRLISRICRITIPLDTADFRIIARPVVAQLRDMRERHRFVRGLIPWVGFRSAIIQYNRDPRYAGETKYPLRKMIALSKDAIFSFSYAPLKMVNLVGYTIAGIGFAGALYVLALRIFTTKAVPGLTTILLAVVIMGGIQIIILGTIGEYIGRIFEGSKNRPLYIVSRIERGTKAS